MESQLKWLLDYTVFHIGAYITLSTLIVGLLGLEGFKQRVSIMKPFLIFTLLCFIVAGASGGVIASNIPYFKTFENLSGTPIGPAIGPALGWLMPLTTWTTIEHYAFWSGVLSAFIGLVCTAFPRKRPALTLMETADLARRLGKECFDASTSVPTQQRNGFKSASDALQQAADSADKEASLIESQTLSAG